MNKIFLKLFLAAFPLLAVIAFYIFTDPFKIIYHYDSFRENGVALNRDYVTTEMFLKNYDKYKYDSYIFGSSRSDHYHVNEWERHINSTACFHFNGYLESLFGIEKKVEFLHKRGTRIKNALFIIDHELLAITANQAGPIYRKHPLTSGESNLDFQLTMFRYFLDVDFISAYIKFSVTHKGTKGILDKGSPGSFAVHYEEAINEITEPGYDEMISMRRDSFYHATANIFYKRDTVAHYTDHILKQEQIKMLSNIKAILDADNTQYKIVISPLYDQQQTDTTDLRILQSIFGKDRVYDFSGINEMTQSIYNYYESSHYRSAIATQIMDSIYAKK